MFRAPQSLGDASWMHRRETFIAAPLPDAAGMRYPKGTPQPKRS
jgi:hypothetical protein